MTEHVAFGTGQGGYNTKYELNDWCEETDLEQEEEGSAYYTAKQSRDEIQQEEKAFGTPCVNG